MRTAKLVLFVLLLMASAAQAQSAYPSKPITMVVAFAPGGGTDTTTRLIAKEMAVELVSPSLSKTVREPAGASGQLPSFAQPLTAIRCCSVPDRS